MPYKNDPRRTITLNLHADAYAALAEDALQAGYATPGTYALAVVRARGEAPDPILDQRTADRLHRLEGQKAWLLAQVEAQQARLKQAGLPLTLVPGLNDEPQPRSWPAQQRAIATAVAKALERERQQVAQRAANQAR